MADNNAAPWWNNPDAQGEGSPVVRHAPDQHNYHVPDQFQMEKMRGSRVGKFAVIPAANKDGTSKGFDPTIAGPVHVDPDAPDGGVIFDPETVHKSDINRAVANSYFAHQAYYQLGTSAPLLGIGSKKQAAFAAQAQHDGANPHMPNTYVTPSSSAQPGRLAEVPAIVADGFGGAPASYNPLYRAQEGQAVSLPPLNGLPPLQVSGPAPVPQQQPQQPPPQQYPQPAYYQAPQPYQVPPMDPNLTAMMQGMVNLQQTVAVLAQRMNATAAPVNLPPTTGMSPNPLPLHRPTMSTQPIELQNAPNRGRAASQSDDFDDTSARPIRKRVNRNNQTQDVEEVEETQSLVRHSAREREENQQTVREYERSQQEPEGVIVGFETLNLKFVTGPIGHKAKKQVIFEIPGAGKHMAKFHDVIESKECVVLVYDTRYEEGQQYEPPELNEKPITLHVPHLKKTFQVASMGFSYPFGVFDMIVLVKQHDEKLEYPPEE